MTIGGRPYAWDPDAGRDLSRPESFGGGEPVAFGLSRPRIEWVSGSADDRDSAPFRCGTIHGLNPHAMTHIEGPGHIGGAPLSAARLLDTHHFPARLVTVAPERAPDGDRVVTEKVIADAFGPISDFEEAVLLRTLPRGTDPPGSFTGTNPPYVAAKAARLIRRRGTRVLLVDLPSLDREDDGGLLAAHHAFLDPGGGEPPRAVCELISIPGDVEDGRYILTLIPLSWEIDACPVRPILYPIR